MKALIALLALLLISPVSAETSMPTHELEALKVRLETIARQFLKHSREAEIEFRYEQKLSLGQEIHIKNKLSRGRKLEQVYCYRILYRKTPDGRLHYEIESRTTINGKLHAGQARV